MTFIKKFSLKQEQQICQKYFFPEKLSTYVLAKKYNCSSVTIRSIIRRNGFKLRTIGEAHKGKHLSEETKRKRSELNKIFTKNEEQKICQEYFSEEKPSTKFLGKKWNCDAKTIFKIIKRNGYKLRTRSEAVRGENNSFYRKQHSKKTKQKIREKTILQHQNSKGPFKDTKPELIMKNILTELTIPFEHLFRLGNHLFDFHILNTNIIIEVDGDYWHGNSKKFSKLNDFQIKQKEKDLKNEQIAKKNGFIVIRFWEDDILKNTDKVIEVLKGVIDGS